MENKMVFISNIIFEPYFRTYIAELFTDSIVTIDLTFIPYEECYKKQNIFYNAKLIIVCLNYEAFYTNMTEDIILRQSMADDIEKDVIKKCQSLYSTIKSFSKVQLIWFGFEDYYCNSHSIHGSIPYLGGLIDKINQQIFFMLSNDCFIDLKRMIAEVGLSNAYSNKGKYRWNAPYSQELIALLAKEIYKQYLIYNGITKKCIVLDCDNVLWGGILSEDGMEGIRVGYSGLGRPFKEFQHFLVRMYCHGVILAICSKNDEVDVKKVFREHSGMLLKEEYISCFKCNWSDKISNIQSISDFLNIGLESMVFIDDSPFEIEAMKTLLPEVKSILFERDTIYKQLSCFNLKSDLDLERINNRTNTYRTNSKREQLRRETSSFEEYLISLDMRVDIHITTIDEVARITELTQRTNKCTNGKRYTVEQMRSRMQFNNNYLYTVYLSDKFSDLGIVGAMEIENDTLMLFSLSCRALGRGIEKQMIEFIKRHHRIKQIEFKTTEKNKKIEAMLSTVLL